MSDSRNEPNLEFSPAARAALAEAVQDISDELSWRAATMANRGTEGPTLVSVADVAAALEQRPASERRLRRNLKVLAFGTMFYGIVGVIMIAIQLIINGRSDGPLLLVGAVALGTAIPGLTFWTMGFIFGDEWRVGSRRKDASPDELYAFIRFWIVLESAIRTVYSGNFGESRASSPLITMLLNMKKAGFIDSWSFDRLNEMRGLRNKIVHGERAVVARNELTELVRDGREILNRLSRNSGSVRDSASS